MEIREVNEVVKQKENSRMSEIFVGLSITTFIVSFYLGSWMNIKEIFLCYDYEDG